MRVWPCARKKYLCLETETLLQPTTEVVCVYGNRDLTLDLAALCSNGLGVAEQAIANAAQENGFMRDLMERAYACVRRSHSRDKLTICTVHRFGEGYRMIVKGAAEQVLVRCSLSAQECARLRLKSATLSAGAMRVLAVAYKDIDCAAAATETDLQFVGLLGLACTFVPEAAAAVHACVGRGVRVRLLSPENMDTARALARRLGIFEGAMHGTQLDALSDDALLQCIDSCGVFACVSKAHKQRISTVLERRGMALPLSAVTT